MTNGLEIRRKRALYRACHRGTMEMDWLLGRFAETHLKNIDRESLAFFERFLEEPDPDLQNMLLGKEDPLGSEFAELINEIRAFHDPELTEEETRSETDAETDAETHAETDPVKETDQI